MPLLNQVSSTSGSRSQPSPAGGSMPHVGLVAAVPDRDLVAPPELARDAPGPDVVHPLEVAPPLALGVDPHAAGLDDLDRRLDELVHPHEPLQRDQRLDPLARRAASTGRRGGTARCARSGPRPRSASTTASRASSAVMPSNRPAAAVIRPSSPITEISSSPCARPISKSFGSWPGRDLQRAGAELGLDVRVGDDLQPAADDRQDRGLADQPRVAVVVAGGRRSPCRPASSRAARSRPSASRGRSPAGSRRSRACR